MKNKTIITRRIVPKTLPTLAPIITPELPPPVQKNYS